MIEEAVLQRVLGSALKTGGEFAEVFAEDRRNSSALLDDGTGRGAHLRPRPGCRHPGRGGRHHRLRPHRRPQPRPACWPPPRPPRPRPRAAGAAPAPSPSPVVPPSRGNDVETYPGDVPKARKVELLARADEVARSAGGAITQVSVELRRQPPPHPRRQLRRPARRATTPVRTLVRRVAAWPPATPACRPAASRIGHTVGFELFDQYDVDELARRAAGRALTKLAARPAPSGADARRHRPRRRRRAVPRGLRPRPRGRPRGQGRLGVPRPRRRAGRLAAASPLVDDGTMAERVGQHRHRRRGPPRPAQRAHRGRHPHRLHVGLPAGPQGGPPLARATAAARATSTCRWSA